MRKLVDTICLSCEYRQYDVFVTESEYPECRECGGLTERLYAPGSTAGVIGDECDVTVRHGICHDDGSPRHYRSKSEMKRVAASKRLTNHVEHVPERGSDKSKHTSRWV